MTDAKIDSFQGRNWDIMGKKNWTLKEAKLWVMTSIFQLFIGLFFFQWNWPKIDYNRLKMHENPIKLEQKRTVIMWCFWNLKPVLAKFSIWKCSALRKISKLIQPCTMLKDMILIYFKAPHLSNFARGSNMAIFYGKITNNFWKTCPILDNEVVS